MFKSMGHAPQVSALSRFGSRLGAALALSALLTSAAHAQLVAAYTPDEISISGGKADDGIEVIGLRVGNKPFGNWNWASCAGFTEEDAEYWQASETQQHAPGNMTTIGTLVGCRWLPTSRFSPELGFGVRLLSHVQIVDDKYYSTSFQFQEFLGVRMKIDDEGKYFMSLRGRHISNGSIKRPNAGINTILLSAGMMF